MATRFLNGQEFLDIVVPAIVAMPVLEAISSIMPIVYLNTRSSRMS